VETKSDAAAGTNAGAAAAGGANGAAGTTDGAKNADNAAGGSTPVASSVGGTTTPPASSSTNEASTKSTNTAPTNAASAPPPTANAEANAAAGGAAAANANVAAAATVANDVAKIDAVKAAVDASDASDATKAKLDADLTKEEGSLDERLSKIEGVDAVADATNNAKAAIDSAAAGNEAANADDSKIAEELKALEDAKKEHEKECHEPPVYVGKNNIPATETRSVVYVSNPEDNKAKIAAVETPPELVIDQGTLDDAEDSVDKSTSEISDIHDHVKELAEAPLVPEEGEAIMAKLKASSDEQA